MGNKKKKQRHGFKQEFHMNTKAEFSKKYDSNLSVQQIWEKDPDYIVWCIETLKLPIAGDLSKSVEAYKKGKEQRGITKVTCFK